MCLPEKRPERRGRQWAPAPDGTAFPPLSAAVTLPDPDLPPPAPDESTGPGTARERPAVPTALEGVDESTWLDVIQRMDEVYSKLIEDEVALEQKNAELEQSHQFIFSVLSSMSDLVIACDQDGRIQETNAALRELVGRSHEALLGRPFGELLASPADEARARALALNAGCGPGQRDGEAVELQLRDAAGQPVPVEVRCTPRHDGSGARVGHVLVGRPVGELRRAYQQLQETHRALQSAQQQLLHSEKLASLGRLVAGVAHELNNPISFVLGNVHAMGRYCERLGAYLGALHGGSDAATLAELRQRLRIDRIVDDLPSLVAGTLEGAQRTAEIVAGLKRFSAIDREPAQAVELGPVVERAIHWVRKGASADFTVHWQPVPGLFVMGSAGHLLQVFMNLIQNAWDAASGARVAEPQLWITAGCEGGRAVLRFRDNGPGVPPELRSRVFDPFFTTKPVGKGTGLGLSISYGLVEQHGGQLEVRSPEGGGAEFVVTLPLVRAPGESRHA